MEEMSTVDSEVAKARNRFRLQIAKAEKLALDMEDPSKQAELAATPPHLLSMR
jgi:hypothetical protein